MSQLLSVDQVIALLEKEYRTQIYQICAILEMTDIEGTDHKELMICAFYKENVDGLTETLKNVINVKEVKYIGIPAPHANYFNRI